MHWISFCKIKTTSTPIEEHLDTFCQLDDHDVMATIKNWCHHPDKILATLCRSLVEQKIAESKIAG